MSDSVSTIDGCAVLAFSFSLRQPPVEQQVQNYAYKCLLLCGSLLVGECEPDQ